MDNGNLERVLRMAGGAADAIRRRVADLERLERDLAALDGHTCTGVEYLRREDGKPDRLYMNHSIDQACPMHGKPSPGGRLRSYVGSDQARIEEARAALEREKTRHDLEHEAQTIRHGLADCEQSLQMFFSILAGDLPEDNEEALEKEKRTSIERAMAEALDQSDIEHHQQHRFNDSRWLFDEFVPPNVLIEVNGDYWHSSEKAQERDARKAIWAEKNGYRLVTIWEHEIKTQGIQVLLAERIISILEMGQ